MKLFTTFCCAALALCSAIYAQSTADRVTVHFNTPVIVGETKLPAGNCDIQIMRGSSDSTLSSSARKAAATALAVVSRMSDANTDAAWSTSVVLNRRGDDLHLYRVLLDDHTGYQLLNAE